MGLGRSSGPCSALPPVLAGTVCSQVGVSGPAACSALCCFWLHSAWCRVSFNVSRFTVCFNGVYTPGIKNDCIMMSGGTADRGDLTILTREIPTGSGVHQLLPNLRHAGKCINIIPLKDNKESQEADAQVNGLTVSKNNSRPVKQVQASSLM
ncbi:hypothetical protein INR49_004549 [Caranx melampygus]|nr:hypothetical protein INR49_004549 [Caranx melampygus]